MELGAGAVASLVAAAIGVIANLIIRRWSGDRTRGELVGEEAAKSSDSTVEVKKLRTLVPSALDQLEVVAGQPYQTWILPEDLTIGRDPRADIVLDDTSVSRRHARLFRRDGLRFITDLGSRNGLVVNGTRVAESEITNEDLVQLGDVLLRYRNRIE